MDNKIFIPQHPIQPIKSGNISAPPKTSKSNSDFSKILAGQLAKPLTFSNHAQERMKSRNITLSEADLTKLQGAIEQARSKGAKDSLVLMNDLALVVSVKNNIVITAVDGQSLKENVFTHIDSAVIV